MNGSHRLGTGSGRFGLLAHWRPRPQLKRDPVVDLLNDEALAQGRGGLDTMTMSGDQIKGILTAYRQVIDASWPNLHPAMAANAANWPSASAETLEQELRSYLQVTSSPPSQVRIFWKLLPGYTFGGCNEHFARDAGLPSATMVGIDDFDRRLPWVHQAAKYRADDEAVVRSGHAKLNIVERQREATGNITWVRVGKAPIRSTSGVIGVLGAYEVLDAKTGQRLFGEQTRGGKKGAR